VAIFVVDCKAQKTTTLNLPWFEEVGAPNEPRLIDVELLDILFCIENYVGLVHVALFLLCHKILQCIKESCGFSLFSIVNSCLEEHNIGDSDQSNISCDNRGCKRYFLGFLAFHLL
jgi:hypothetical protein